MADVLFTLPGRLGDNLLRLPIAYQYAKQYGCLVDLCLDSIWSVSLMSLLGQEKWVDRVFSIPGIISDGAGGQPWDFGKSDDYWVSWQTVYHLGFRFHPRRDDNLTLFALAHSGCPIDPINLLAEPCFAYPVRHPVTDLAIHVQASNGDQRTQLVRGALLSVWDRIVPEFETIHIVAHEPDPQYYAPFFELGRTHFFEDGGDFRLLAGLLTRSLLVGTNSAMWTLARCLKSPVICLIDPISNFIVPGESYPWERIVDPTDTSRLVREVRSLKQEFTR
jgi:hypothetical protein